MKVEDLLAPGEKVLLNDGNSHFTDRRLYILARNSFVEIPYEHISSVEFERRIPFLPIGVGVIVLLVGLLEWISSPTFLKALGIDPTLTFVLIIISGIVLIGMGLALTRRALSIQLTSGKTYTVRVGDQRTVEEFLKKLWRPF